MTRDIPEQTSQEHGACEQPPFLEPMLKNREFVQSDILNPPYLRDLAGRPIHQVYIAVSSFFPIEIQESIWSATFELYASPAFPPRLGCHESAIFECHPHLNVICTSDGSGREAAC